MILDARPLLEMVPALPLLEVLQRIVKPTGSAVAIFATGDAIHHVDAAHLSALLLRPPTPTPKISVSL